MMNVEIKLYSQYRKHGTSGPKPTKKKSAAASKVRQILTNAKAKQEAAKVGDEGLSESDKTNDIKEIHVPSAYGEHQGNTHVETFLTREANEENLQSLLIYTDNMLSKFEVMESWDLFTAKNNYSSAKEEINSKYLSNHGESLQDEVATQLLTDLEKHSFTYAQHQIVVIITSDIPFEGAKLSEDKGYRREIRSKRIYTEGKTLLPAIIRQDIKGVSKDESELSITSNIGKTGRIITNPKTGKLEMQIDFGNLAGRIDEFDSY